MTTAASAVAAAPVQSIAGCWNGMIETGGAGIAVVLRIANTGAGITAAAEFPQQGRTGTAFGADATFVNGVLRFSSLALGQYTGLRSADGSRIDGEFVNQEIRYRLVLHSGEPQFAAPRRPQTPQPPFGYSIEPILIDRAQVPCRLAGTLTIPADHPIRAAVLLINGSGALDRDETVFGHKPFLILAHALSSRGYAVLRLDDRGVAQSSGDRSSITIADEVADMDAAITVLRDHPQLGGLPVGLIGHSMGSSVGRIVAAQRGDLAFLVSLAGAGLTMGEVFAERECAGLRRAGHDAATVRRHGNFIRALFDDLQRRPVDAAVDTAQVAGLAAQFGATATASAHGTAWIARFNEPWFRSAVRLDPAAPLRHLRLPVLALNGSLDTQVPAASNLAAIAGVLGEAGHPDVQTHELPGLNHLFQTASTGEPYEYPIIEETFAPLALALIGDWLDARFTVSSVPGASLFKEPLMKSGKSMVRQAHHERNQALAVHPETVEGLVQTFLHSRPHQVQYCCNRTT